MTNLQLIEDQPRWRVALLHYIAKLIGVTFKVEGVPFGSFPRVNTDRVSALNIAKSGTFVPMHPRS